MKIVDFLIGPIYKKGVLNAWEKELDEFPIRLNRHEIVHGVDVNYGTEVNSLKTLSLLAYVDTILRVYNPDHNPNHNSAIPLSINSSFPWHIR